MKEQKYDCIFNQIPIPHKNGCNALNEYLCNEKDCPFFKSRFEYRMVENGFIEKRGGLIWKTQ